MGRGGQEGKGEKTGGGEERVIGEMERERGGVGGGLEREKEGELRKKAGVREERRQRRRWRGWSSRGRSTRRDKKMRGGGGGGEVGMVR